MSKSACIAIKAPGYVGMPYKLGEEGRYVEGPEQTSRIDIDCSGLVFSLFRDCDVRLNGRPFPRETADDYWRRATKLSGPERIGDCCWFPRTGRKTHIALYVGGGKTIEAGYHGANNRYPGHGYVGTCTVAQMNARGAVWGRIEGLDIYDEEDEDMDQATFDRMADDWAKRNTVTTYASDLKEAVEGCAKLGLLETKHKGDKPITASLFRVALWRLAKKAGL